MEPAPSISKVMEQPKSSSPPADLLHETPVQSDAERTSSSRLSLRHKEIPSVAGGYEVLKCLGEGSFGSVWLARERKTGRQVAIKFFTNRRGLDWSLLTREVEKLAVLDASRDVVRLLDVGVDHDPPYFVMEYLPHRSLDNLLESGPLSIDKSIEITRAVARALVHAHSAGILHCDIKPGNVLLDHGDEARLGDFGQSRLASDQGSALGTFYYMAPEQAARNAVPDVRWDVYALGALLYHMLTGNPPYRTPETEFQLRAQSSLDDRLHAYRHIISTAPLPADHRGVSGIDAALVELVDRCLHRDPAHRIPNPQVVLDLLDKRDFNRARRPLVWLGFLGPILFLFTLIWVAARVVPEAVGQAEMHLSERALASDMATVRLLAHSIQQELLDRQADLERLGRQLAAPDDQESYEGFHPHYVDLLDTWRRETDSRLKEQLRTADESLFLTDRSGIQIYRSPWKDSVGHTFSYRDYFHGLGRELSPNEDAGRIEPRTRPGISMAFRSSNTGQFMVAITVPVWNADSTRVIGVLGRTIHLSDLLKQWEQRIGMPTDAGTSAIERDRMLTLVDMREEPPLVLDHHWIQAETSASLKNEGELKEVLRLKPQEEQVLRRAVRSGQGLPVYQDPLADVDPSYAGAWLAAVAQTSNIDWIAIVQERRSEAVRPMENLYLIFLRYGLLLLVVFALMLAMLAWLIRRTAGA